MGGAYQLHRGAPLAKTSAVQRAPVWHGKRNQGHQKQQYKATESKSPGGAISNPKNYRSLSVNNHVGKSIHDAAVKSDYDRLSVPPTVLDTTPLA